jgi:hypothetical protein
MMQVKINSKQAVARKGQRPVSFRGRPITGLELVIVNWQP